MAPKGFSNPLSLIRRQRKCPIQRFILGRPRRMCVLRFVENEIRHKPSPSRKRAKFQSRVASDINQTQKLADELRRSDPVNAKVLHDFRIGLRRIQASARILREVNGKAQVHSTLTRIKNLLKATGPLRAEQVLPKVFSAKAQKIMPRRLSLERRRVLSALDARLTSNWENYLPKNFGNSIRHLILEPLAEVGNKRLRRRIEGMVKRDCRRLRSIIIKLKKHKSDVKFQHKLRIRAKQLGYVLELMVPKVRPRVRKIELFTKRNQKIFGRLHDLDCAIDTLEHAPRSLKSSGHKLLVRQLRDERPIMLKKALKEAHKLANIL
jgi:CHAD domain-containing protein